MSEQATTAAAQPKIVRMKPFGIEADHPRNCDLMIQAIPGCRLRGAVKANRAVKDFKTGHSMIPVDQSRHLATFPEVPGMQLHINPSACTFKIFDPLEADEETLERLRRSIVQNTPFRSDSKLKGVKAVDGTLDVHRMKTLVREIIGIVEAGEAKVVLGTLPDMDDVNALPGNFLLNPGSRVPNQQPVFEKDYDGWLEQLTRSGG